MAMMSALPVRNVDVRDVISSHWQSGAGRPAARAIYRFKRDRFGYSHSSKSGLMYLTKCPPF